MNAREQEDQRLARMLQQTGVKVNSVFDLVNSKRAYPQAIAPLLRCLAEANEPVIKEGVVRALAVREARGVAEDALPAEFEKIHPDEPPDRQLLKWAIGNTLAMVATNKSFARITELVRNRAHGTAREMLAVALGNLKNPHAPDVLIELLKDEEVAGHALMALGKLKAQQARPEIEHFRHPEKAWIRHAARKALAKLDGRPAGSTGRRAG